MKPCKPRTKDWKGIVIHSAGQFIDGTPAIDFIQSLGYSAHYFVNPDGTVDQMIPLDKVAFHAGKSEWKGMSNLNENFIGIEVLVEGDYVYSTFLEAIKHSETFKEAQYIATARLCYSMLSQFPTIDFDNIVRHSDVSGKDVRPDDPKYDPGEGFSLTSLKELMRYKDV